MVILIENCENVPFEWKILIQKSAQKYDANRKFRTEIRLFCSKIVKMAILVENLGSKSISNDRKSDPGRILQD